MDLKERINHEYDEDHRVYHDTHSRHSWHSSVAQIADDSDGYSASSQPVINGRQKKYDGTESPVTMPLVNDVPIVFAGGGGVSITHPVKKGDEGLLIHPSRPIDTWWQSGGMQDPIDHRYASLSDALLIPGLRNQTRKLSTISKTTFCIRSDDNNVWVDVDPVNHRIRLYVDGPPHKVYVGGDPDNPSHMFAPIVTTSGPSITAYARYA
jgi:hypothetical protein